MVAGANTVNAVNLVLTTPSMAYELFRLEQPVFFRGLGRYRYRNRCLGSFRLQKTILDADTDSDTDAELRFSG